MTIKYQMAVLQVLITVSISFFTLQMGNAADIPELTPDLCIMCHRQPPVDIESAGGKHKSKVTCLDCHEGHPPLVEDNIPQCSSCHEGTPHFELKQCMGCHSNPHTPLNITLADNLTDPCLTCHTEQIAQLKEHPSRHTELACTNCHSDKHGRIPDCMECHTPHGQEMSMNDCITCHRVHMPLVVMYPEDTPSKSCAACHEDVYNELVASSAKHNQLQCAKCHQAKHKMIPECKDCHGVPHPAALMMKFSGCSDCHDSPHNLIH